MHTLFYVLGGVFIVIAAFAFMSVIGIAVAIPFALGIAITLAVSLAAYGIVRAIGWVIGGFAAS